MHDPSHSCCFADLCPLFRAFFIALSSLCFVFKLSISNSMCKHIAAHLGLLITTLGSIIYLRLIVLFTRIYYRSCRTTTVAIKSIRRSQVTSLLNLTKSHRGHTKNGQKSQNMVQKKKISYKLPSKIPNIVIWRNHNFVRQVTGHNGWRIDLIATVSSPWRSHTSIVLFSYFQQKISYNCLSVPTGSTSGLPGFQYDLVLVKC